MPKFHNKKINTEFGTFDSTNEYKRYVFLLEALKRGEITGLEKQVEYEVIPKQTETYTVTTQMKTKVKVETKTRVLAQPTRYKADFVYTRARDGKLIVEDFKGFKTKDYVMKVKLMLLVHHIKVKEVFKPNEPI